MLFCKKYIHILILLIPFILSILWHSINTQVPISDAIGWLQASAEILQPYWNDGDFSKSLYEALTHRPWRPVIFHLFVLPFLFITNGDFILTTLLVHAFFVLLSTLIIYKIFSLFSDKIFSAVCAVILSLSTNIMFGGIGLPLFAELAFVPVALMSIYSLLKSNFFTIKKYSYIFSAMFFLVLALRPVEGILYLAMPVIIFLFIGNKKNKFNIFEISKSVTIIFTGIAILLLSRLVPEVSNSITSLDPPFSGKIYINISLAFLILYSASLVIFYYLRKNSHKYAFEENYLIKTFALLTFMTVLYWYPYFSNLYNWVYGTSIGKIVNYYEPSDWTIYQQALWAFKGSGLYILICLVFITILYTVYYIFRGYRFSCINTHSKEAYYYFLAIIPIPWIIYLFTVQSTYRKVSIAMVALLVVLLIYIVQFKKLKKLTLLLLLTIMCVQSIAVYKHTKNDYQNTYFWSKQRSLLISNIIGNEYPVPININPNPHNIVIDFFKVISEKYNYKKFGIIVDETGEPVDAFLMYLISMRQNFSCSIMYITSTEFIEHDYSKILAFQRDSYLLINPKGLKMEVTEENANKALELSKSKFKSGSAKLAYHFQYLYSSGQLSKYGFEVKNCIEINNIYTGCIIVKK